MFTCMPFRRYPEPPIGIHAKNQQKTPDILTFGIMGVGNTDRCGAVFISEPESVLKILQRDELNVQDGENGLSGFDGTAHRSRKFEEYVRRIVDYI